MNHPCLCDICLTARDVEIVRLRKRILEEFKKMIGEDDKPLSLPFKIKRTKKLIKDVFPTMYSRNLLRQELRAKLEEMEGK